MAERDAGVRQSHDIGVLGLSQVVDRTTEPGQRGGQQLDLGVLEDGGDEERLAGLDRQLAQRAPVGLLEASTDGHRLERGHDAVDVVGREQRRQVHQGQRVAAGGHDERGQPVLGHVDAAPLEQLARVLGAEAAELEPGQLLEPFDAVAEPSPEDDGHSVGQQAASGERHRLDGRGVHPVDVVHEDHERSVLGDGREHRQRRQPGAEPVTDRDGRGVTLPEDLGEQPRRRRLELGDEA